MLAIREWKVRKILIIYFKISYKKFKVSIKNTENKYRFFGINEISYKIHEICFILGRYKELCLMSLENSEAYSEFEERSFRRIPVKLSAKFTLKEGKKGWENCTIININRNLKGMGVIFHTREEIPVHSIVIIDLLTDGTHGPIYVTGVVRWTEDRKSDFVGGIALIGDIEKVATFFNSKATTLMLRKKIKERVD